MSGEKEKTFPVSTGFGGFPAIKGFPSVSGFPAETPANIPKEGKAPKNLKFFEGSDKLNKTETRYAWREFGGDKIAVFESDGRAYVTRIIERESKKSGAYFKLTEKLVRDGTGHGILSWRLELGAVVRRKPAKTKFDEGWKGAILARVRAIAFGSSTVTSASKDLAEELGVSYSTVRATLWVSDKWIKGERSAFLPHKYMIRPIFDLLCELGKKEQVLSSLKTYCAETTKPSKIVLDLLDDHTEKE